MVTIPVESQIKKLTGAQEADPDAIFASLSDQLSDMHVIMLQQHARAFSTDVYLDSNRPILRDFVRMNLLDSERHDAAEDGSMSIQVTYGDVINMLECLETDYSYSSMRKVFASFRQIPEVTENILFRCDFLPLATLTLPAPSFDTVFRMLGRDQEVADLRCVF